LKKTENVKCQPWTTQFAETTCWCLILPPKHREAPSGPLADSNHVCL
jgi:hypothetical protein